MTASGLGPSARRFLVLVVGAAVAGTVPLLIGEDLDRTVLLRALVLALGAAGSRFAETRNGPNIYYSLDGVFVVAAVLLLPPGLAAATVGVASLAGFVERRPRYITIFNAANTVVPALAAAGAAAAVPGGGLAARGAAACVAEVVVNHGLLAVMLSLARSQPVRRSQLFTSSSVVPDLGLAAAGVAIAQLWLVEPRVVPFALLPLVVSGRLSVRGAGRRHDATTGLVCEEPFLEELERETDRARRFDRPLAVLALDLCSDRQSDGMLIAVANVLRETLRPDDVPARCDGEFAVLLPETRLAEALDVAERIRGAVAALQPGATAAVGVAACPEDGVTPHELRDRSRAALLRAKRDGGDRVATPPLRLSVLYGS